jgi:hypothetical protein
MPPGIADRDADVWEALLSVAIDAGGAWPERANVAAVALVADSKGGVPSLGIQLLSDIREVFGEAEHMPTATLLEKLHALEESPWCDLRGKPLTSRGLSSRFRQYSIKPTTFRMGTSTPKGYRREDLHDAWLRYLGPPHMESPTSETPATCARTDPAAGLLGPPHYESVTSVTSVTSEGHSPEDCTKPLVPETVKSSIPSATFATFEDREDPEDNVISETGESATFGATFDEKPKTLATAGRCPKCDGEGDCGYCEGGGA